MEIDNITQNIPSNTQFDTENNSELLEMPQPPRLTPTDVPLSMYM